MKRNAMPLFLLTMALVVALGLLFTGCGLNQADEGVANDPQATLIEQESLLEESLAEIEALEAELAEAREAAEAAEAAALESAAAEARENEMRAARERAEAEAAAQPVLLTVPASTALELDLLDELSSETNLVGDPVNAVVARDVIVDGLVAIPAGSELRGVLADVVASRKFGGQARLLVVFDTLIDTTSRETPIAAALELAGQRQKKKDAATIGGAAAGGAILGRILNDNDRSEGTAVGAVLGGAIGTIVAAKNQADPVVLPSGSALVVTLDAPLTIELDT